MMSINRKTLNLLGGPLLFLVITMLLKPFVALSAAEALGTLAWMVFWWASRPVNMTVTALLPVLINAVFGIVPMGNLISAYSSPSIILIFGTSLMSIAWTQTGLDKRVALRMLSMIGPSMSSQITVWFLATVILSTFMPNVAVVALYCPIVASMMKAAGYDSLRDCPPAVPVLLAIGWGAGVGGAGSPLGGAMNITAITYLEQFTGREFLYVDWMTRMIPYLIIVSVFSLIYLLYLGRSFDSLSGTREYFDGLLRELPKMSRDEKICLVIFLTAVIGSFTRPLYSALLPHMEPAYIFMTGGFLMLVINAASGEKLVEWQTAEKNAIWGMMLLFGGGIALGTIISSSGAAEAIAALAESLNLEGTFMLVLVFAVFAVIMSELTNSTVSAAVVIPVVLTVTQRYGLDPIPFWFAAVLAYNSEVLLPLSVRSIPVSYGLDPDIMLKKGIPFVLIRMAVAVIYSLICIRFIPGFGVLS